MTSLWYLHVGEFEGETVGAASLRLDQLGELVHRVLHVPVDDQIVVVPPRGNLLAGAGEPPGDLHGPVAPPLTKPRFQVLHRRRHDEPRTRLRIALTELPRPVRVDVEQDVEPAGERALEGLHGRAVVVAVDRGPFGEGIPVAHVEELGLGDEVEVGAVHLAWARRPRRVGDGVEEVRHELAHLVAQRCLPGARRSRDDDEGAPPLDQLQFSPRLTALLAYGSSAAFRLERRSARGYSMFCTCSRIFSSADLAAMAACESSRSSALEPTVLTSRCISWMRKSSVRPTGPPSSRSRANSS